MSYYPWIAGEHCNRDYVVMFLEDHIRSDAVENKPAAEQWLNDIRNCRHETIMWSPFAESFGASPLNWRCWQTPSGEPICDEHTVSTTSA